MPPRDTEYYAGPLDVQRRADALLKRWNELSNQALGPGVKPRADIPSALQDRIIAERKAYRKFVRRPGFGLHGLLVPRGVRVDDYEKLTRWYEKYRRVARELQQALPTGESLKGSAMPLDLPGKLDFAHALSKFGRELAIVGGVGAAVYLTIKLVARASSRE